MVRQLAKRLSTRATVRLWSDSGFFRPGLYYLDNLIHELPEFDFAVFIFGPDDMVTSRGQLQSAPRDNVIFEFGYAMAKLGRERVFHLVPKGPGINVKVLSDLAGMKPWEYQMPTGLSGTRARLSRKVLNSLDRALEGPSRYIGETIARLGPRTRFDRGVAEGPQYVSDVYESIAREFTSSGTNEVKNLALDMEQTWPAIRDRFLLAPRGASLRWLSLIIDPRSTLIKRVEGPSFTTSIAAAMIANMTTVCRSERARLAKGPVSYHCRTYDALPGVHGFLVNDRVAYVSLCGLSQKWSEGTGSPYLRFQRAAGIEAADHMIQSFRALFDYHWTHGRAVWPPR